MKGIWRVDVRVVRDQVGSCLAIEAERDSQGSAFFQGGECLSGKPPVHCVAVDVAMQPVTEGAGQFRASFRLLPDIVSQLAQSADADLERQSRRHGTPS